MAITVTELVETVSTSNTESIASASYTPTANRGLIAFAYCTATNVTPTSIAGNGLTWTLEDNQAQGANRLYTFSALSGASPSTGAFTFSLVGNPVTAFHVWVGEFTGCDLTDHVRQVASESIAISTAPTATFAQATESDCAIIGAVCRLANPPAMTPPTGYTEIMDAGVNNPSSGMEVVYHLSPGAVSTVTWGNAPSTVSACVVVEIVDGSGASASPTPSTVAAVAAVPGATVAGTTRPSMTTVAAVTDVPAPVVSTSDGTNASVTPATVAAVTAIDTPTLTVSPTAVPTTVAATAAVATPAVTAGASITLTTIGAQAQVDQPTISAGVTVTPTTVAATVSIDTPANPIPDVDAEVALTTVAATVDIPTPFISHGQTAARGAVRMKHRRRYVEQGLVSRLKDAPRSMWE